MEKTENDCIKQMPDSTCFETPCGIGPCQPRILQHFKNVLSFSIFYGFASLVTQTLFAYIVSQVTALEKQFNIDSTTTGLILSCNDIGFLCAVILISHFGRDLHIPRILSAATFLFGFSGVLASLGYFINPVYLPKLSDGSLKNLSGQNEFVAPLCAQWNDSDVESCDDTVNSFTSSRHSTWPIWLLCISMVLQGVGKSPRVSLSMTYIDNNNSVKTKSGFHIGISTTMNILGPALALALGGVFRSIPVDLQDTDLTPVHPKWIGAWWMGFLVFGSLSLFVGIPLLFFPKHILPFQDKQPVDKTSKTLEKIKDLPRSVFRVVRRPVYTTTLIGILFQTFVLGGSRAFSSKYVEKQFMIPAYKTNIILGVATIISVTIGTFTGGVLTSRLKLTQHANLRLAIMVISIVFGCNCLEFFLGCETPHIYGFREDKGASKVENGLSLCTCDTSKYFPVCGEDGMTYFSPCFAGCRNQTLSVYGGCSRTSSGKTTAGMCETDCPYLYYYIVVESILKMFGTTAIMPVYMIIIRSVEPRDKTVAVGLLQFLISLVGFLPAPILFGYVVDSACLIWGYECGTKGACALYDLGSLRIWLKSTEVSGRGLGLVFLFVAFLVLKKQVRDKPKEEETGKKSKKAKIAETTRL